jgi:hypothetical protein
MLRPGREDQGAACSFRYRYLPRLFRWRRAASAKLVTAAAMAMMSLARLMRASACSTMRSCRSGVVGPAGAADRNERAVPAP